MNIEKKIIYTMYDSVADSVWYSVENYVVGSVMDSVGGTLNEYEY